MQKATSFTSAYSGKPLSELPREGIWEGIPVATQPDGEGLISEVIKHEIKGRPYYGVKIDFKNGAVCNYPACLFKDIIVK